MLGRRTGLDFSEHQLHVKETEDLKVYYLKKPNTSWDSIKYINTNGILAVTGDYGNWIFCREFQPTPDTGACNHYWLEKLRIDSTQNATEYDMESTLEGLLKRIIEYKEEYVERYGGEYHEDNVHEKAYDEIFQYLDECLDKVNDEYEYELYAYRERPNYWDTEDVIFYKKPKAWFLTILDGFDEICRRLKEKTI